jgi:hypothetical protein
MHSATGQPPALTPSTPTPTTSHESTAGPAPDWAGHPAAVTRPGLTGSLLSGIAVGSALMYWFDPRIGRRRRAVTRDWLRHAARKTYDAAEITWHDLSHRTEGLLAETSHVGLDDVSDEVLVQRVRAALGRAVRHPSAIEVTAERGRVTLRGPILTEEVERLFRRVTRVRGVRAIDNQLEPHDTAEGVPALQGAGRRRGDEGLIQTHWSPTARLLAGLAGAWLAAYPGRRGVLGLLRTAAGAALLARAVTNQPLSRVTGVGLGPRAASIEHSRTPSDDAQAAGSRRRASEDN